MAEECMTCAWIFPGQGSQTVGMAYDVYEAMPEARRLFDRAEEITGLPIAKLCFEGPADALQLTIHAQPCLLTACAALMLPLQHAGNHPDDVAGHSIGEYTALFAAGVLSFEDALQLVYRRGVIMHRMQRGTMTAILGLSDDQAVAACVAASSIGTVVAANFNAPGQVVISGQPEAVAEAGRIAKEMGATKVVPLKVSGAFHSPLMLPAAQELAEAIAVAPFKKGGARVASNVDAALSDDPDVLRDKLVRQLYSPVHWSDCMRTLQLQGVTEVLEIGPGKVLAGLLRHIDRSLSITSVNSLAVARQIANEIPKHTTL